MSSRIAYIIGDFCQYNYTNRIIAERINWLAKNYDCSINVLITFYPDEAEDEELAFDLPENVQITILDEEEQLKRRIPGKYSRREFRREQRFFLEKIKYVLREWEPQIVISSIRQGDPILYYKKRKVLNIADINYSCTNWGFTDPKEDRPILKKQIIRDWQRKRYFRKMRKYFKLWVVKSQRDVPFWNQLYDNVHAIPDPIPAKRMEAPAEKGKSVIALGEYSHWGGFKKLIEHWTKVSRRYPDWKLKLCGKEDPKEYQELINQKGLQKFIVCLPEIVDINEVASTESLIATVSQNGELESLMAEAINLGIPCLGLKYPLCHNRVIIDNKNGFLFYWKHEVDLIVRLQVLMSNEEMRKELIETCPHTVEDRKIDHVMKQWVYLFESYDSKGKFKYPRKQKGGLRCFFSRK